VPNCFLPKGGAGEWTTPLKNFQTDAIDTRCGSLRRDRQDADRGNRPGRSRGRLSAYAGCVLVEGAYRGWEKNADCRTNCRKGIPKVYRRFGSGMRPSGWLTDQSGGGNPERVSRTQDAELFVTTGILSRPAQRCIRYDRQTVAARNAESRPSPPGRRISSRRRLSTIMWRPCGQAGVQNRRRD
jgi:hypothetical protein